MHEESERTVVVVGAGVMGTAIVQVLATAGLHVNCVDRDEVKLAQCSRLVEHGRFGIQQAVRRGRLDATAADAVRRSIHFDDSLDCVCEADFVIEAIPEELDSKMQLLRQVAERSRPSCVLASNTSGLPITALAEATDRPSHVIGWHWSSPAQVMKLAEIVRTKRTAEHVVDRTVTLARRCGKNPIVVWDSPRSWGFVANRVLRATIEEAHRVVADGVASPTDVDAIMVDAFGWPVGPLSVLSGASDGWGDGRGSSVAALLDGCPDVHESR